jgi:hypothetical protein
MAQAVSAGAGVGSETRGIHDNDSGQHQRATNGLPNANALAEKRPCEKRGEGRLAEENDRRCRGG